MNNLTPVEKFLKAGGVVTKLPEGKAQGIYPTYSTKYSVANIGRKAATLRDFGLAKAWSG
jgi:hypothetical protein